MKYLLNGAVIAAALAIGAPVWAQTGAPMNPSPAAPPAAAAPDEPMASSPRHHRARRHRVVRHARESREPRGGKSRADNMANELNQQELSRSQGSAPMAAPAPAPMPMAPAGPRPGGR